MTGVASRRRIVIAGGGAAGVFAALAAAESAGRASVPAEITVCEAGSQCLAKVRISGGGRCNVTNACTDPGTLVGHYPRGGRELLGPLTRFGPRETAAWFEARGVRLKAEEDGRMFPVTDSSSTIIDCLLGEARRLGVQFRMGTGVSAVSAESGRKEDPGARRTRPFEVSLSGAEAGTIEADRFLLATGGTRGSSGLAIAGALGHSVAEPVPSLFTFTVGDGRLQGLAGLSVERAEVLVPGTHLRADGPILVTHKGLSGPAILRLSAWGARELHARQYCFPLCIRWTGALGTQEVLDRLGRERSGHPRRQVAGANPLGLPGRLWERLAAAAGLGGGAIWAGVSKADLQALAAQAAGGLFEVAGKSVNKEEFVTCGGVNLREVHFATMGSRLIPGLHFAGEVLDIDGVTGGFNFQAAWTTGWHAGRAMGA